MMDKYGMARRDREKREDLVDKGFRVWFAFVGIASIAMILGVVWLIVYVVPHIVHALDRIH